jgi:flavin-dependent dehydrogenase
VKSYTTEICVIGGGPAGAAAAYRLARLGHSVMLIERRTCPHLRTIESLPSSVLQLLEFLDLTGYVDECLRVRAFGTAIRWQDTVPQFRAEGDNNPFLINRNQFDEALLAAAKKAGVHTLRPVAVCQLRSTSEGWEIEVRGGDEGQVIRAAFLIVAAGKNSLFARPRQQLSPSTVALIAHWQHCTVGEPLMCVDVGTDFWCWGCRLLDGTGHTIAFVDRNCRLSGGLRDSRALWSQMLTQAPLLAKYINGELIGRIATYDATAYQANSFASASSVCIGDAAVTLDPLSSQGVQTALSTALQGSLVAHTALTLPENMAVAVEFYESRLAELARRHMHHTRRLYAQQRIYRGTEFWLCRSHLVEPGLIEVDDMPQQRPAIESPITTVRYRVTHNALIRDLPAATGNIVSLQPSLIHPSIARPLTYVDGLPIAPLLSAFASG